ncbi:hypothetical protein [Staphylococcus americanisciuri]|uniref:hypothetical protein n=1 Tax=Staphylococcus americanisciuri TaxID=2973940 RepID=UPI003570D7AC
MGDYYINNNANNQIDNKPDLIAYRKAVNYAHKKGCVIVAAVENDGLNVKNKKEWTLEFMTEVIYTLNKEDL